MNRDDHQVPQPKLTNESTDNTVENAVALENSTLTSEPTKSTTSTYVEGENEESAPEPEMIEVYDTRLNLESQVKELTAQVQSLEQQKQGLTQEIKELQDREHKMIAERIQDIEQHIRLIVKESLKELKQQKQALEISVEQLQRRRDRIKEEMRTTFAGVSQDLAIRVQGFKDYLVGSLQDLAATAEQLELPTQETWSSSETIPSQSSSSGKVQFIPQEFEAQTTKIKQILDQYRKNPDYYGFPWQLRRTFEPIHAERVQTWFFSQGGRGAIRSMGTRLQNILIASAIISVLNSLHSDRSRFLILANSPERLGEWRRGLQDCLGISRSDFGPEKGVVLFESPDALVLKAERLLEDKQIPLVIIDETEQQINLSLLQFPLLLAFAPDLQQVSSYSY
ncbi:DUF3086 domain-containing protein [cyanobacterium endosymbiont of Epithemia clementina EcSB]|uniref:DUF3086 domain-containing protein n=1 Tax=cyanobacterium endosymbiont of Epithemia clementina EcSB TaxID=3034674 RepID=UPI00247FD66F|nr:DUF3086 domain-containing protein [cyanobacterium endosymbiont of Epithemia clementina EcSB]WGT67379.1 DUF3086 domain-containing protein [cyanobacterium endosymbiont of Epithemia clementina EcSB]